MRVLYWTDDNFVTKEYVRYLIETYSEIDGEELIRVFLEHEMPGQFALVSSFGIEAAVLLHMVSRIDKNLPVIFIETQKLFDETVSYRDELADHLGLTDIRNITPSELDLRQEDKNGDLHKINPNQCCYIRKVLPLEKALEGFDGWISGRKRFHGGSRSNLPTIEMSDGRVKINPLAFWPVARIQDYFNKYDLPRHPMQEKGYLSVGCQPCTSKPVSQEDVRSGRWVGQDKQECGIHLGTDGKFRKSKA